ncbi:Arc family DNA-binding protein [Aquisalimonas sp.]|uniref:FitA-like ribbon-helix-helix domain-containing protein n=1 Tax=Aquisalimonas sp. TaxID=1872621 RepID=UPI0025BD0B92|nr:Arc family DNA-binding protein [Aquisalimonas sp.]
MATMTLKNVPDELYERLKEAASRHRRSLNNEAIVCLEQALESGPVDPKRLLAQVRKVRARGANVYVTDDDLRAARDEGRP